MTADLLLGHVLGCDRVRVLTHPEMPIIEATWALFLELVCRRIAHEPLRDYLTAEQEFYGLVSGHAGGFDPPARKPRSLYNEP